MSINNAKLNFCFQSYFNISLLENPTVTSPVDVAPVNSPRVGLQRHLKLVVDASSANGEIGFESADEVVETEPPANTGVKRLPIRITREGLDGDATISWTATGGCCLTR